MENIYDLLKVVREVKKYSTEEIDEAIEVLRIPVEESVKENYLELKRKKDELQYDAMTNKYNKKNEEDYEKKRQIILETILEEPETSKQIQMLLDGAAMIKDAAFFLAYNEMYANCCRIPYMIETSRNMMLSGFSLKEINKALSTSSIADIYGLSKKLGIRMLPTEEEQALIELDKKEEENRGRTNLAKLFGRMRHDEENNVPIYDHKEECWKAGEEDNEKIGSLIELVCEYVGTQMIYPFNDGEARPNSANNFDGVLKAALDNPDKVSIDGFEEYYSVQERELLNNLLSKLQKSLKEKDLL